MLSSRPRSPQKQKRVLRVGMCGVLLCLTAARAFSQQNEYSLKAAFLINFLKFIEWPDSSGPYVIEIAGKNPFGSYLENMANGRLINGRKVVIRTERSTTGSPPSILFVPSTESSRYSDLLQYAKKPIVVIGESAGFAKKYGAINFILDHDRVAFEINPRLAKSSGVKVSSRLLQLAKIQE